MYVCIVYYIVTIYSTHSSAELKPVAKMKFFSIPITPLLFLLFFFFFFTCSLAGNVTYDRRSLIINGQRKLLISASIHYPRSVPGMWPGLVQTAKEGGIDVIETYVFWNGHELSPGNYYFGGRYDLVKFAKIVQQAGMYLILRIGPFVAAEWNFGGIPVWLHYVPGTVFRSDSEPFKYHMQNFTTFIVNLMKQEKFFASQGGPIILAQIENEYGDIERVYGDGGKPYAMWAAKMALSQNIGVPWIMCQQYDAPDPVINTCNSFYCDQFTPNSPNKPKMWTENWPGWFKTFGGRDPHRPPEDVAYAVARFFQKGGSLQNYYMYHGGTNFGRTSGGPFITTSYDYDAPIDEYGLPRLPKWGHLKELHKAIKLCEHALLNSEPVLLSLGPLQEADVYAESSGACAAFIANMDDKNDKVVEFRNVSYHLPAWSVSILADCKNVVFNTAKVGSQTSLVEMVPENLQPSVVSPDKGFKTLQWEEFVEKAGIWGEADFVKKEFVDHINTTKDTTDYLWYTTSLNVDANEEFLKKGSQPVLIVESKGHALHAFVNQELQASASGNGTVSPFKFKSAISLKAGKNEISLLSMTVGLQNAGPFYERVGAGPTSVKIEGLSNGTLDLSAYTWTYKIGLQGEHLSIYKADGLNSVNWVSTSDPPKKQPLTWYKAVVDPPPGDEPVGLDMIHMGKGLAWLNGEEIGRYWPRKSSIHDECVQECNYRGKFSPNKCSIGCGQPTQRWYHVPRSWFKPSENVLVIFEEKGGDPTKITFSRRKISGVCAHVSEDYPSTELESWHKDGNDTNKSTATVRLKCPKNTRISTVKFASFGTPTGTCGSYSRGDCHDPSSTSVIEKVCLNKNECAIELTEENFNKGLCSNKTKKLAVEAIGLQGEHLSIYKADGLNSVNWVSTSDPPKKQPLTWYKAVVDPPPGDEPVGLDMINMGKGLAWLNGEEIGRYWPRKSSIHDECVQECNYRGKFSPNKCSIGCGQPTQRWYHVPRSWFKPSENVLVIFEEKGGDPTKITFSRRKISGVCAHVSEDYPSTELESWHKDGNDTNKSTATVRLKCPKNTRISTVKFASFGTPTGTCGSYSRGDCHDPSSTSVIEKVCLNKNDCAIELTEENFNKGLCSNKTKKLAVEAVCS